MAQRFGAQRKFAAGRKVVRREQVGTGRVRTISPDASSVSELRDARAIETRAPIITSSGTRENRGNEF